jgi:predicted ribosomally synthesized peptide with SipW-like signal peptide
MKRILLSFVMFAAVTAGVSGIMAAFTDTASATDNIFQAGTLDLELSDDGMAWAENTSNIWVSPTDWAPGDEFTSTLWLRNAGTIDIATLNWDMSSYTQAPDATQDLGLVVNLTEAFYDINNNGAMDAGEDIEAALLAAYDTNTNSVLTLREMHDGMLTTPFNLEAGANVMADGAVKRLIMTWEFDAGATNVYQGRSVTVDFDFEASNI